VITKITRHLEKRSGRAIGTAIFFIVFYVAAYIVSIEIGTPIPVALHVILPGAAGILLGIPLPVDQKGKNGKANENNTA
jgi:hypothetical protein